MLPTVSEMIKRLTNQFWFIARSLVGGILAVKPPGAVPIGEGSVRFRHALLLLMASKNVALDRKYKNEARTYNLFYSIKFDSMVLLFAWLKVTWALFQ